MFVSEAFAAAAVVAEIAGCERMWEKASPMMRGQKLNPNCRSSANNECSPPLAARGLATTAQKGCPKRLPGGEFVSTSANHGFN